MSAPALPSSRESSAATHGAPSGADFTSTPTVQSNLRVEREVQVAMCVLLFALPLKPVFDLDHVLEIGPLSVLSLSKVAGLAFVVCFLRYLHRARPALRLDVLHVLLFGMLALAMLSALQARSPATAWATVFRYASVVALYWALTQLLAAPAAQLRSLWTLVASCALAGGIALRGFVLEHSAVATLPHGDPNDVAFVLATTVPLAIGLVVNAYGWRAQRSVARVRRDGARGADGRDDRGERRAQSLARRPARLGCRRPLPDRPRPPARADHLRGRPRRRAGGRAARPGQSGPHVSGHTGQAQGCRGERDQSPAGMGARPFV